MISSMADVERQTGDGSPKENYPPPLSYGWARYEEYDAGISRVNADEASHMLSLVLVDSSP